MSNTRTPTVEAIVVGEHQKLKECRLHGLTATSWQAQYALETAKGLIGAWPTGAVDKRGHMVLRMPTVDEVVDRAFETTEKMLAGCAERGWTVDMPAGRDLIEDGASRVGFTNGGTYGQADKGGEALPGEVHSASPDSRRG